jgi:hypothetical protein
VKDGLDNKGYIKSSCRVVVILTDSLTSAITRYEMRLALLRSWDYQLKGLLRLLRQSLRADRYDMSRENNRKGSSPGCYGKSDDGKKQKTVVAHYSKVE